MKLLWQIKCTYIGKRDLCLSRLHEPRNSRTFQLSFAFERVFLIWVFHVIGQVLGLWDSPPYLLLPPNFLRKSAFHVKLPFHIREPISHFPTVAAKMRPSAVFAPFFCQSKSFTTRSNSFAQRTYKRLLLPLSLSFPFLLQSLCNPQQHWN